MYSHLLIIYTYFSFLRNCFTAQIKFQLFRMNTLIFLFQLWSLFFKINIDPNPQFDITHSQNQIFSEINPNLFHFSLIHDPLNDIEIYLLHKKSSEFKVAKKSKQFLNKNESNMLSFKNQYKWRISYLKLFMENMYLSRAFFCYEKILILTYSTKWIVRVPFFRHTLHLYEQISNIL